MATYMPSPGPFKAKDAEPEATLEMLVDYLEQQSLALHGNWTRSELNFIELDKVRIKLHRISVTNQEDLSRQKRR
jgi:hypothetical protein